MFVAKQAESYHVHFFHFNQSFAFDIVLFFDHSQCYCVNSFGIEEVDVCNYVSSDNKEVAVDDKGSSDDEDVANSRTGEPDTSSALKLYQMFQPS